MKKELCMFVKVLLILFLLVFLPLFLFFRNSGKKRISNEKSVPSPVQATMSPEKIEKTKILLQVSSTIEEIDEVLEDYAGIKNYKSKIEFLRKHFEVNTFNNCAELPLKLQYHNLVKYILRLQNVVERVESKNSPHIEWEYYFESIGTKLLVATMYYKGRKVFDLYEDCFGHRISISYEYRFIASYCPIFIHRAAVNINEEEYSNYEEYKRNKLIASSILLEERFIEIIEEIKAVI